MATHLARASAGLLVVAAATLVLAPAGQRLDAFVVGALAVLMLALRSMRADRA